MSNEMEFIGKQSLALSKMLVTNEESKVGWSSIVTGWLHRWKAREQSSVYASYAEALRQEIEIVNARRELMLEKNEGYQQYKDMLAAGKVVSDQEKVIEEIQASLYRQGKMKIEHDGFVDQSEIDKEELRRKKLNPNKLLEDDLRILNRQILDLDKDAELDQESRRELLEILMKQKRKMLDSAKGVI